MSKSKVPKIADIQIPFQMVYKELQNSEEIAQDFLFLGAEIKSHLNYQKALMFGSLFFCYIDQCAKNLDIKEIKYQNKFFNELKQQQNLLDFEKQQIEQIQQEFKKMTTLFKKVNKKGCGKCQKCKNFEICENFTDKNIEEVCKYLCSLENQFIKQNKENNVFDENFELCASFAIMEKLVNYRPEKPLSSQDLQRMHTIILESEFEKHLLTAYMKQTFKEVCKILQISCTLYQLFEESLIKIDEYQSLSNKGFNTASNYNIIFNQNYTSFRFGYCTTKTNELNMLKEKVYSQKDQHEIHQQTQKICHNINEIPEIKQKESDIQDFQKNRKEYIESIKSWKQQQNKNIPILRIWNEYIKDLQVDKVNKETQIKILEGNLQNV
ncbi:hypothetical protein ABPG74_008779 [Tetrahymena malaccensis]